MKPDVTHSEKIKAALFGVAIGDAVGVPYEFSLREKMINDPAIDMIGYGTYNQPPGTWSDDSSLSFCLAESLATEGIDLAKIASNFCMWKKNAYWAARNEVFDIGITTSNAIHRLSEILEKGNLEELRNQKNYGTESENGNGSLMRIIPLLFYITGKPIKEQFDITWDVSALTHRHIRAAMSCLIYLKLAENILNSNTKERAYTETRKEISDFWNDIDFPPEERLHFKRLIQEDIRKTAIDDLKSGGYVIEVLESSIWFFLNKDSYKETVLSIINIGHDTDTSAAIAGGLAGIYYGYNGIPEEWLKQIARKADIENLANRLGDKIASP